MSWKADLEYKPWSGTENLRIWRAYPDRIEVLQPFQFKSYDRYTVVPDNEIAIVSGPQQDNDARAFLQMVMDVAWSSGLRPAGFDDHTNELAAVRAHLADMRSLAFIDRVEITGGPPKIDIDLRGALNPK